MVVQHPGLEVSRLIKNTVVLIIILLLSQTAEAIYSFEGVPYTDKLNTVAHGTLNGGVYIDGGYGLKFTPYTNRFDVPGGVKWARVYVGVWGGTENYEGWVQMNLNGNDLGRTSLLGKNDNGANVYSSGYGIYWIYYDVTDKVTYGINTATANTSRGEMGNKLDGRVYGIVLAAIYEDKTMPEITYWLNDGNVNLHGQGWSGTLPTANDYASVSFPGLMDTGNIKNANLTVTYLTGTPGLPDYLEFNNNSVGTNDIANAGDGSTPYFDLRTFDVAKYIKQENSLLFLRGKDINNDGKIAKDDGSNEEGEDYLHPVLAVLVVQHNIAKNPEPDLTVNLKNDTFLEGENNITALLGNYGGLYEKDFKIKIFDDDMEICSDTVRMDASGIKIFDCRWNATHGMHTITAKVDAQNAVQESNETNNIDIMKTYVKSKPDLSVKILTPETNNNATDVKKAGMIPGVLVLPMFIARKRWRVLFAVLIILTLSFSGCVNNEKPQENVLSFSIPVEVINNGEAAAQDFDMTLYVDGERSTTKHITALEGGTSTIEELALAMERGDHSIRVIVDEKNNVSEAREDNNADEITYTF
jgi:subtilase family serine protease